MTIRVRLTLAAAAVCLAPLIGATVASAAELPRIKAGGDNAVPACTTPGRLTALLQSRNPNLDARFEAIAVEYMRHGEALGIRWDVAFFQMMVETGNLKFGGDVKPDQNNFAGLGATGGGVRGEAFRSIGDGVKAHLQHIVMYTGERVDDPVADRTRKAQDGRWLEGWRNGIGRPLTFSDLARKWAPSDRSYARTIATIQRDFRDGHCGSPDPAPQLVALARGQTAPLAKAPIASQPTTQIAAATAKDGEPVRGEDLARQALERAKREGNGDRAALGGPASVGGVKILNKPAEEAPAAAGDTKAEAKAEPKEDAKSKSEAKLPATIEKQTPAPTNTAAAGPAAGAGAGAAATPTAGASAGCKVWTASYGGAKSVIIQQTVDRTTNYTVLDVNEGNEAREVETYISTYAKNGKKIADFANQQLALDRAFQLCPEG